MKIYMKGMRWREIYKSYCRGSSFKEESELAIEKQRERSSFKKPFGNDLDTHSGRQR